MKKFLLIGLIIALILIVVGGAGMVYAKVRGIGNVTAVTINTAQNGDKIVQQFGYGPGGMLGRNGNRYGPGGMMGGDKNGYGPGGMMGERGFNSGGMMHGYDAGITCTAKMKDYMISAFASAVGLTTDEVNTRLTNGETLQAIALAQGKTEADLPALWTQVCQDALNKAVADGVITQAQADLMLQHMKNYSGPGFGPGFGFNNCPMMDGDEVQP
jgi:hypothetical protein